jgi:hypothetical protein
MHPRRTRSLTAILMALAAILALGLSAAPANADTNTFRDRRDDVRTANDIRWIRVNYDTDLNVTFKLKGLPRGEVYLWIDGEGTGPGSDYVWYGTLGDRNEDFALYTSRRWGIGEEVDCGYDYTRNRENFTVRLEISGDCFADEYDGVRVSGATTYWQRSTDTYINVDYAPARRAWYPYTDNG